MGEDEMNEFFEDVAKKLRKSERKRRLDSAKALEYVFRLVLKHGDTLNAFRILQQAAEEYYLVNKYWPDNDV